MFVRSFRASRHLLAACLVLCGPLGASAGCGSESPADPADAAVELPHDLGANSDDDGPADPGFGDDGPSDPGSEPADTGPPCEPVGVASKGLFPSDGRVFAFIGAPLLAIYTKEVSSATITLKQTATGAAVAGTHELAKDGRSSVFTPGSDLEPKTNYTVTVEAVAADECNELSVTWSFRTSQG